MRHLTTDELEAGLPHLRSAPADEGVVELIVRRPAADEREVLEEARLDPAVGLEGDRWSATARDEPDTQLTLMGARVIDLIAGERERWPLAGDQLYVDLDLSVEGLPVGTRLELGEALVEITDELHAGCAKFRARFGADALRFVNQPPGRALRLRGVYARVVRAGTVRTGDAIRRVGAAPTAGPLDGTGWVPLEDPTGRARLDVDAAGTAVSGCAGVNRIAGPVALDGEAIRLGPLVTTRMAGPPEAMAAEDAFLAALGRAARWALDGEQLRLLDEDGALVLALRRDTTPAPPV